MTSNYKQTSIVGDSWIRARRVVVENPYQGRPTISFVEEKVINLPGNTPLTFLTGGLKETLTTVNATQEFNLVNPITGDVIGVATLQDVQVMLHSLYYHLAAVRDAGQVPTVTEGGVGSPVIIE